MEARQVAEGRKGGRAEGRNATSVLGWWRRQVPEQIRV
jgi:hypothetical protein